MREAGRKAAAIRAEGSMSSMHATSPTFPFTGDRHALPLLILALRGVAGVWERGREGGRGAQMKALVLCFHESDPPASGPSHLPDCCHRFHHAFPWLPGNPDGGRGREGSHTEQSKTKQHPRCPDGGKHHNSQEFSSSSSRGKPVSTGANRLHMRSTTWRRPSPPLSSQTE